MRWTTLAALLATVAPLTACGSLFQSRTAKPDPAKAKFVDLQWNDQRTAQPQTPPPAAAAAPTRAANAPPRPAAVTAPPQQAPLWRQLAAYENGFLAPWEGAFSGEKKPAPIDVVQAFAELAYAVSGPGGFWRKTVPNRWLGCPKSPSRPECRTLHAAKVELAGWDRFVTRLNRVTAKRAAAVLDKHADKMKRYLSRFAPTRPRMSEMTQTGFYREHLATYLAATVR